MNKQEANQKIEELQEKIEELKKVVNDDKWPQKGNVYHFLDDLYDVHSDIYHGDPLDNTRLANGNFFKTIKEANIFEERLIITQMLRNIAKDLNEDVVIDWYNRDQKVYSLSYNMIIKKIYSIEGIYSCKYAEIYCLKEYEYLNTAIERIGEQRLIDYFKNY